MADDTLKNVDQALKEFPLSPQERKDAGRCLRLCRIIGVDLGNIISLAWELPGLPFAEAEGWVWATSKPIRKGKAININGKKHVCVASGSSRN